MKKRKSQWWRGRAIDIWSIPHFVFGVVVSMFALLFGVPFTETLLITLVLAIFWEYFEMRLRLREERLNVLADVLLPLFACLVTFLLLGNEAISFEQRIGLLTVSVLFYIMVTVVAWRARLNHERGFMR
ncbi:MAG: hypothetical protein ABI747_03630 [Candidatus Moraniibacteriota bacterium]